MDPFSGKCNSDAGADKARGQRRESGTPGGYQKYLAEHFGAGQGDGVWAVQYLSEPPGNSLLYGNKKTAVSNIGIVVFLIVFTVHLVMARSFLFLLPEYHTDISCHCR